MVFLYSELLSVLSSFESTSRACLDVLLRRAQGLLGLAVLWLGVSPTLAQNARF
jgi:hypothetical protein